MLAVVLAALAIALAAPLRQLISQRAQIASARSDVKAQSQGLAQLQKQERLWSDPAYVAAQARDRLHYVRPGQVPYITLSPTPAAASVAAAAARADQPWYAELWSSVEGAASTPKPAPTPTPAPAPNPAP